MDSSNMHYGEKMLPNQNPSKEIDIGFESGYTETWAERDALFESVQKSRRVSNILDLCDPALVAELKNELIDLDVNAR